MCNIDITGRQFTFPFWTGVTAINISTIHWTCESDMLMVDSATWGMNRTHRRCQEKQNESLPPNISWADVLEEKLTPSEETTGKCAASTTSFDRKGLRFGMESSPASAEVKGSMQARERSKERERGEKERDRRKREEERRTSVRQQRECMQIMSELPHRQEGSLWVLGNRRFLPAQAVATGRPVDPACMEGWKVCCMSKRSLSIFRALGRKGSSQQAWPWTHAVTSRTNSF